MTLPSDAEEIFKRGWVVSGLTKHTYSLIPYIRPMDFASPAPDFQWLESVDPKLEKVIHDSCTWNAPDTDLKPWPTILEQVAERKLVLPESFKQLVNDPGLQSKIPTCTSCYLSLSEEVIPLAGTSDHFLLRFLNDQQSCFLWYLCLSSRREPFVIVSPYFFEKDIFEAMEYETNEGVRMDELPSKSYLCAETFLEFVYRFWLENTIWYAERDKLGLSNLQKAYLSWIGTDG